MTEEINSMNQQQNAPVEIGIGAVAGDVKIEFRFPVEQFSLSPLEAIRLAHVILGNAITAADQRIAGQKQAVSIVPVQ